MQSDRSRKGNSHNQAFREALAGGYFSYNLATAKETNLALRIRYWGAENGNRTFDIYIDDQKILTENLKDKWNRVDMVEVEYVIPAAMLNGKDFIRVKFQATEPNTAGPLYYIRLVKPKI
ncbi:DUF6805 domain-containing protein [Niabella hibiscisoli]|uniref:DUF6805 domain-containing protein n=1 Tax=Niabella hibiscisoli TaxID=1825928 RepID=UPI001F1057A9|nr:DUF6805 domain-containing protein [Niabella hibiscisoli]MCH5719452.1 hypothetical protein [Niabella hibiscisoli]